MSIFGSKATTRIVGEPGRWFIERNYGILFGDWRRLDTEHATLQAAKRSAAYFADPKPPAPLANPKVFAAFDKFGSETPTGAKAKP